MKSIQRNSGTHPLCTDSRKLRHHKLGVMASSLGYCFVAGIVFIAYARYLGGDQPVYATFVPEFKQLTAFGATVMVGMRIFVFQWLRLNASEQGDSALHYQLLLRTLFFSEYLGVTRSSVKNLSAVSVLFILMVAAVVTFWSGALIAARMLWPVEATP